MWENQNLSRIKIRRKEMNLTKMKKRRMGISKVREEGNPREEESQILNQNLPTTTTTAITPNPTLKTTTLTPTTTPTLTNLTPTLTRTLLEAAEEEEEEEEAEEEEEEVEEDLEADRDATFQLSQKLTLDLRKMMNKHGLTGVSKIFPAACLPRIAAWDVSARVINGTLTSPNAALDVLSAALTSKIPARVTSPPNAILARQQRRRSSRSSMRMNERFPLNSVL